MGFGPVPPLPIGPFLVGGSGLMIGLGPGPPPPIGPLLGGGLGLSIGLGTGPPVPVLGKGPGPVEGGG
jgi:hypothetical protein